MQDNVEYVQDKVYARQSMCKTKMFYLTISNGNKAVAL